jgi:5'-nucleotidase
VSDSDTRQVLVTNDDGVDSPGIWALAAAARSCGFSVLVASPAWDSSGASASLTAVLHDGRLLFQPRQQPDLPDIPGYAVEAPPAYIVATAASGAFGPTPDIVLSGINTGANTGQAILHSGTVGAALTAATYGCRSMAVSLAVTDSAEWHWATAQEVAAKALEWLATTPPRTVLNVNVPNVERARLRGFRAGTLARYGLVQTNITESGRGWVKVGYEPVPETPAPGTDSALVAEGYACYTALNTVCESGVDTSPLERLIEEPATVDGG